MTLREEALKAVEEVPEYKLEALIQFARFLKEADLTVGVPESKPNSKPYRKGGWVKGEIWMSDDFDDQFEFVSREEMRMIEALRESRKMELQEAAV